MDTPTAVILAGPNGAGKTTMSTSVIPPTVDFLNADVIAAELRRDGHSPAGIDIAAGRIVLSQIRAHVADRRSFCTETNLAGRGFLRLIEDWRDAGFTVRLVFAALEHPDIAIRRVAARVAVGGHDIPESVIRRRWSIGLRSLFALYIPVVDDWTLIDNSGDQPALVAEGSRQPSTTKVVDEERWAFFRARGR